MIVLFISGQELFVVFIIALLLFGSKKIPDLAKGLGKGMREFKKATQDIKDEINRNTEDVASDVNSFKSEIRGEISDIHKSIENSGQ